MLTALNEQIWLDTAAAPYAFRWNGPVQERILRDWVEKIGSTIPDDLLDLWRCTGGGDIFDSETIFTPAAPKDIEDSVDWANEWFRERGMSDQYLVFHNGVFVTAVHLRDGAIVQLDHESLQEIERFASLRDWYLRLIRPAFADAYGLPAPLVAPHDA